jgi:hypothetical protein
VFSTPLKTLVFHIWVVNTTYYIETIDFRIREKIFEHQYGGSPYNVALFFILARNTSTVRTNLMNKRTVVLRMQEMAFQGFKFQTFSGRECPRTPSGKPAPLKQIWPDPPLMWAFQYDCKDSLAGADLAQGYKLLPVIGQCPTKLYVFSDQIVVWPDMWPMEFYF